MFDLSLGELLLTLGVGVMLVGRKDLPKVAHTAGYWVGRGVGTVQASRRNLEVPGHPMLKTDLKGNTPGHAPHDPTPFVSG